ncbi:hypothetical protein C2G38_2256699 [Gigaspora rosea]|uniref:Uncharacterized protein n=1 Tax=Gigaspora rosea TaxID=44941 RepID=A0A397TZ51_9GLOM|nr:hypothetical protein C2G38_2256699 [Gigaspora rosea]
MHTERNKPEPNPFKEDTQQNTHKGNNSITQYIATEKKEFSNKQGNLETQKLHEGSALDKYKKILLEQECGTLDYGIKEILKQNESISSGSQLQKEDIMEDIPLEAQAYKIKNCLSYYGKASIE